jgi:hypothetical protein
MAAYFGDDPVLMQEYRDRIASDFTASSEAAFLKGLRNYVAHMQLPVARSQEAYTAVSVRTSFILSAAPLLAWDGWNAGTRAWIASHGGDVPIVDMVDTYPGSRMGSTGGWRFESKQSTDRISKLSGKSLTLNSATALGRMDGSHWACLLEPYARLAAPLRGRRSCCHACADRLSVVSSEDCDAC